MGLAILYTARRPDEVLPLIEFTTLYYEVQPS